MALEFITTTSGSCRGGGGGSEIDSGERAGKISECAVKVVSRASNEGSHPGDTYVTFAVGTTGVTEEVGEVALLPTLQHGNSSVPHAATTGPENLSQVNLLESGVYPNLVIDTNPDSSAPTGLPRASSTRGKYKLFRAPLDPALFARHCFSKKGRAQDLFCLKLDCSVAHKGGRIPANTSPGEGFIQKDRELAFCQPSLDMNRLDDGDIPSWLEFHNTVPAWQEIFSVAEQIARPATQIECVADETDNEEETDSFRGIRLSMEEFKIKTDEVTREFVSENPESFKTKKEENVFTIPALPKFELIDLAREFADDNIKNTLKSLLQDLDEIFLLKKNLLRIF